MTLLRRGRNDGKVAWLATRPWWRDLPVDDLQVLAATGDRTTVPAGRTVMTQGERGREAAIILAGEVEVICDEQVIATLGPSDVIGELSLLDGAPRTADVRAATDVELLVFSTRGLERALASSRPVREYVGAAAAAHRA